MDSKVPSLGFALAVTLMAPPAPAHAEQTNACAGFYESAKGDRQAADVYISVKSPEEEGACFLVPRAVIDRQLRPWLRDGDPYAILVEFEPIDLFNYLVGKESIVVGTETRTIAAETLDCLRNPTPVSMSVMPRSHFIPLTIENVANRSKHAATDFPGYQRYSFSNTEDHYFVDTHRGATASFSCAVQAGVDVCQIVGAYGRLETGGKYTRSDMARVQPEAIRRCLRLVAELFRVGSAGAQ